MSITKIDNKKVRLGRTKEPFNVNIIYKFKSRMTNIQAVLYMSNFKNCQCL
jgi:hypothetical protein